MSRQLRHSWQLLGDAVYPWSRYRCRICGANVEARYGPPSTLYPMRWEGRTIDRFEPRPDCVGPNRQVPSFQPRVLTFVGK